MLVPLVAVLVLWGAPPSLAQRAPREYIRTEDVPRLYAGRDPLKGEGRQTGRDRRAGGEGACVPPRPDWEPVGSDSARCFWYVPRQPPLDPAQWTMVPFAQMREVAGAGGRCMPNSLDPRGSVLCQRGAAQPVASGEPRAPVRIPGGYDPCLNPVPPPGCPTARPVQNPAPRPRPVPVTPAPVAQPVTPAPGSPGPAPERGDAALLNR
jgi:hypothetical protein